ncbi:hypothetical protein B0T22DRAFT_528923 [Podospora appendiculata]|uniref:NAD(P)-binding protein n=1 Tax=Podospora appendiculata TaxID=314037 RepID=A0AAE1CEE2_9PEZI|nr:hypothetical protein B0T22DRAFT_528923 [Podospora appendiculata]
MLTPKNIVLVTGANTGIGYETVKALLQSPTSYHVLLGSRSIEKGNQAVATLQKELPDAKGTVELLQLDLESDESIAAALETIKAKHGHIDTLVNNAGIQTDSDWHIRHTITLRESFTKAYNVNVAGTHVLTYTLAPLLLRSASPRLIFVSSSLGSFTFAADEARYPIPVATEPGWPKQVSLELASYRASKSALNMLMVDWKTKLRVDGVKVFAIEPGFLATDIGGLKEVALAHGAGEPSEGGRMVAGVVQGGRDGDAGELIQKDGIIGF